MQKFILSTASAALAAVGVLSALAAAPVSAAQIYPVDQARFMTNAKFDFKIELDKKADRKNVVVEINGADYKKVLKGSEIWVPEEIDSEGSALIMRDVEIKKPGKYTVVVKSPEGEMRADWDLYSTPKKAAAKNVIILLADGLSVGHRTAARILSKGVKNGMYQAPLAMDNMPHMALLGTSSVDTIAADSANTASAYMTGHKSSVNALGVYADRTKASQDDPRQETIAELLRRKTGKAIGVVSDAEIEDATPASVVAHTRRRSDKADIVGMFYEVRPEVILGGGSAYFLPQGTPGSKRKDSTNYLELFQKDGYKFVSDRTELLAAVDGKAPQKLLGLFHTGNMDGWIDRHQWKGNTVKKFPNQPDLTDAFDAAVKVLGQNKEGFYGFPDDFAPSKRLAVFFGAHPDYYETYRAYPDKTFNPAVKNEKGEYVADETYKSVEGGHFVEGNLPRNESQGVHTVDDLVVTARGPKSEEIKGFMNSTEIFRVMAEALALGH